ncbi:MAG: fasciclin domain-containing protein [Bacteroidota bacterium]
MPRTLALSLLTLLLLAAPASFAQETAPPEDGAAADLLTTLESLGDFTVLVQALRDTGLDAALAGGETFTLFAPTDDAFQALPAGTLDGLSSEQLTGILRRHVLVGAVSSEDASALGTAATVEGSSLDIIATGDGLMVGNALVSNADVQASNGVIHVISAVLLPDAAPEQDGQDRMDENDLEDLTPQP